MCSSMGKRYKSRVGDGNGYDYFESLPDEVVIIIFTKLSSSSGNNTLEENIKPLVQCATLSKRFNALNSLVTSLSISHPSIKLLHKCFPKILNKFKHICSLNVYHSLTTETELYGTNELKTEPCILGEVVYEPDYYCLLVVSCTHMEKYSNLEKRSLLMNHPVADHVKQNLCYSTRTKDDASDMMIFHHMLVSSIREHKMLERVVVANISNPELGSLILEGDMLVKLKNCISTNLEQVQSRYRNCFANIVDIPLNQNSGFVMSNIHFDNIEWWARPRRKAPVQIGLRGKTLVQIKNENKANHNIPKALRFKGSMGILLQKVLKTLLENYTYRSLRVSHSITDDFYSKIKPDDSLL